MSKNSHFCVPGPASLSVAFSPDGSKIATGSPDGEVCVMDATNGNIVHTLEGHSGPVKSVAFSPDGRKIVTGSSDTTVCVWDAENGELLDTLQGCTKSVTSVAFSADGETIVAGCADLRVRVWNKGELVKTLKEHSRSVTTVAISSDGSMIVSGSDDKKLLLWSVSDGSLIDTFMGHTDSVTSVCFSPDGSKIASGSADKTVRIWDTETADEIHLIRVAYPVNAVHFSPSNKKVVFSSTNNQTGLIGAWHFNSNGDPETIMTPDNPPLSIALNSRGNKIVYGTPDGFCVCSAMSQKDINTTETLSAVANVSIAKQFKKSNEYGRSASQALGQGEIFKKITAFAHGEGDRGSKDDEFAPSTYYKKFTHKRRSSSSYGSVTDGRKSRSSKSSKISKSSHKKSSHNSQKKSSHNSQKRSSKSSKSSQKKSSQKKSSHNSHNV